MLDGLLETFFRAGWKILGTDQQLDGSFGWRPIRTRLATRSACGARVRMQGFAQAGTGNHRTDPRERARSFQVSDAQLRLAVSLDSIFDLEIRRTTGAGLA
jgi:hypothetical protein